MSREPFQGAQWVAVEPQPGITEHTAPPGTVWVCSACGKVAHNRITGGGGWDESCFLRSVLCKVAQLVEEGPHHD